MGGKRKRLLSTANTIPLSRRRENTISTVSVCDKKRTTKRGKGETKGGRGGRKKKKGTKKKGRKKKRGIGKQTATRSYGRFGLMSR